MLKSASAGRGALAGLCLASGSSLLWSVPAWGQFSPSVTSVGTSVVSPRPADDNPLLPPLSLSRIGSIGLIRTPSADVAPDGFYEIGIQGQVSPRGKPRPGDEDAFTNAIGFLPRLEVSLDLSQPQLFEDISLGVKVQPLTEGRLRPAVALGSFGLKGTTVRPSKFLAASKHFLGGRLNGTVGYLTGGSQGGYGGLEAGLLPHLSAQVEYDTRDVNYGVRAAFVHNYLQVAATHLKQAWTVQFGLHLPLSTLSRPAASVDLPHETTTTQDAPARVEARLRQLGLEDIVVRMEDNPRCLEVSYDNRSFPHSELNALANVLATEAMYAPDDVVSLAAVSKRENLPVMRVSCNLADYRQFMSGQMDVATFKKGLRADFVGTERPPVPIAVQTPRVASSYGHSDIIIHPGVLTEFATENYLFGVLPLLQPELYLPVAQGVAVSSFGSVPVSGPLAARSNLPFLGSGLQVQQAQLDQLSLHATWRPVGPFVARIYGGRFPSFRDGAYAEAFWLPGHGRFLGRATAGFLHLRDQFVPNNDFNFTSVAEGRYYIPDLDLEADLTAGQYIDQDSGATLGLIRRFGLTQVGMELRSTTTGRAGVVSLSVTIGPAHLEQRPGFVRLRPPDFFQYSQRSLLQTPNYISVASVTGNQLQPADNLTRTFLDQDQLTPAYLYRSIPELRRLVH